MPKFVDSVSEEGFDSQGPGKKIQTHVHWKKLPESIKNAASSEVLTQNFKISWKASHQFCDPLLLSMTDFQKYYTFQHSQGHVYEMFQEEMFSIS